MAISYIANNTDKTDVFFGTGIFNFNPVSLVFFAFSVVLLWRFLKKDILKSKGRVILAAVLGTLMGLSTVLGTFIIYGNNDIFDGSSKPAYIIPVALGLAIIFTPLISELTGFFDRIETAEDTDPTKEIKTGKAIGYLFIVWGIILLSFIPLFLYWWPGNFIADASYQVRDWLTDGVSTHHPILHTVLLGSFYKLGLHMGHPDYGFQFFTMIQMLIVSGSIACFMRYLYDRRVKRSIRVAVFLCFLLNPTLAYYSISTIKGVWCGAFTLISITFLLRYMDEYKMGNLIKFVLFGILACCFRNNMVYAFAVAGIVMTLIFAVKKKGLKFVVAFFVAIVLIAVGAKVSEKILLKATNGRVMDTQRESMSVPLMCLARVAHYHKDELDPALYNEICNYIDEDRLDKYVYISSDSIKETANEALLRDNKINFFKLVAKVGIKFPGEYLEAISGLTCGYWYLGVLPYYVGGTTKLYVIYFADDTPNIENKNLLPFGGFVYDIMYGEKEGRLSVPVLGWLWRSGLYFWIYVFAFFYSIYRKNVKSLGAIIFPFMYLMTCLLGPVPWLRYIVINIIMLPSLLYLMINKEPDTKQRKNEET
ncbi:MAG: hypothetical protein IJ796_07770 [Lachnospiraceae bacterium]|nr:hypothetical protein [Lachnospiraceae bacterium]